MIILQEKIIQELGVLPTANPKEEVRKSIDFLRAYLTKHPFLETFASGISGGQDSTLARRLAQSAMTEMRKEAGDMSYQFIATRLSYGEQTDEVNTQVALAFIQSDASSRVDIKLAADVMVDSLESIDVQISDLNKGNMKMRQHMIIQYAVADENTGAITGTNHAAENVMAFFTKYSGGGAGILPLFRLSKRQGKTLLKKLGALETLYLEIPIADLEDDKPLVIDEVVLSVTYDAIDDYLRDKEVSETDRQTIEDWYKKGQHRRHLPTTIPDDSWK